MSLWFLLALMTAGAAFAVLWPLGRGTRPPREGRESAVYQDQLAEIDRDVAGGLIGSTEGGAARVEISRRLLAAADAEHQSEVVSHTGLRRAVAVIALVGLPLLAGALYLHLGSPNLSDAPLGSHASAPAAGQSLDQLVAQVQAHLEKNPTDGRGWGVLAPVLGRIGQFGEAAQAYRNAIKFDGDTAARRAGLGEALAGAANGVVTADAKAEFDRAVAFDADDVKARYFLGLAAEQDGRAAEAAAIWQALLSKSPSDAPWRPVIEAALARVNTAKMPALSDDTIAAAKEMNETDRSAMIHGMVDRLAARLAKDGSDVEGWLRLVRAYKVLGDSEKARTVSEQAQQAVAGDESRLLRLKDGLKALGL